MIKIGTAIGMAVGYVAGNEQARQRLWAGAKDVWQSPRARAVEQKVTATVPALTHRLPGNGLLTPAEPADVRSPEPTDIR